MSYKIENEFTFSFEEKCLSSVLNWIWPVEGVLKFDDMFIHMKKEDVVTSVHLFSDRTNTDFKDRMKIVNKKKRLVGVWDTKKWWKGAKYEQKVKDKLKGIDLLSAIQEFGCIVAAFIKERALLHYEYYDQSLIPQVINKTLVKIGIDKVVAFNPANPTIHGDTFYHIEFESEEGDLLTSIVNSKDFRDKSENLIFPLRDEYETKWIKACQLCTESQPLHFADCGDMELYFQSILQALIPTKHGLLCEV